MGVVLDGADAADDRAVAPGQEVLRPCVLPEGILFGGEQRADVHPQLRHLERVAAVMAVWKSDETREIPPPRGLRRLHSPHISPSSFPELPQTSNPPSALSRRGG